MTCKWGRCQRRALYSVTEEVPAVLADMTVGTQTQTLPMCSQHRIATKNEGWSYGATVTWERIPT